MKKLSTIFTILILISFASQKILAWTNYVSVAGSDTAPYDTWAKAAHSIQDAVNYAVEGNVVLVADGNYTVASQILIVTNNIILKSVNGALNTAIDGNSTTHPIYLRGDSVIDGFSIINGKFSNGGGIFVHQNGGTILNCIFTNNFATSSDGGAIRARGTLVSNCYFYANGAPNGGAVFMRYGSSIIDCFFESNFATNGGAVHCYESNAGGVSDCIISNNTANIGGGIYVGNNSDADINDTVVEYNSALFYGGGIAVDGGELSVAQNCHIRDNVAANGGGGIYANNADVSMTGTNTFLGIFYFWSGANRCSGGDGGGMYAINSDIVLSGEQCYVGYSFCDRDGGAFYITNSSLSLLDGAQILAGWTSRNGGGIYAMDSKITMDDSAISYCLATNGAGIFADSCTGTFVNAGISNNVANANVGNGGGMYVVGAGSYNFTGSAIANNSASIGGGLYFGGTGGDFILNNSDIIYNRASYLCGGIYWFSSASLEMTGGRLSHNVSDYQIGAGYIQFLGSFLFNNTEISYNVASNAIAGIGVDVGGTIECIDCDINCNISDADQVGSIYGAAIHAQDSGIARLISLNGTFAITNNSANYGGALNSRNNGHIYAYGDVLIANNSAAVCGGGIMATNKGLITLLPTNGFSPRVIDNYANDSGGGAAIFAASSFTAVNPLFENNISSNIGGAMYVYNASTVTVYGVFSGSNTVPPCAFIGNNANHGGAINEASSCILNISDCIFASNSAYHALGKGGAIFAGLSSVVDIENSVVAHNSALDTGSGIYIANTAFMQMRQCTVTENGTGGIEGGSIAITNSIVWNNGGTQITAGKTVDYCDVDGGYATGNGNIDAPPLFVAPAALDFRLTFGSPCIDTGTTINVSYDCIGNPRPTGSGYDLGAYEFIPEPGILWIIGLIPLLRGVPFRAGCVLWIIGKKRKFKF